MRIDVGAAQGDAGGALEAQSRPRERDFQRGGVAAIADQQVRDRVRVRIQRTGAADAEMSISLTPAVLHGGQRAGSQHPYRHGPATGTKRTRSPGESNDGGECRGSNNTVSVRPMMRQPPGPERG